jgi:hypothetical protein
MTDSIIGILNLDINKTPLIKHYHEKKRIVTIAYTKDKNNNCIAYGAVIYKKPIKSIKWNKSQHVNTAIERLRKYTIFVSNFPLYNNKPKGWHDLFCKNLRRCLIKYGVQRKDINIYEDWDMPELIEIIN